MSLPGISENGDLGMFTEPAVQMLLSPGRPFERDVDRVGKNDRHSNILSARVKVTLRSMRARLLQKGFRKKIGRWVDPKQPFALSCRLSSNSAFCWS